MLSETSVLAGVHVTTSLVTDTGKNCFKQGACIRRLLPSAELHRVYGQAGSRSLVLLCTRLQRFFPAVQILSALTIPLGKLVKDFITKNHEVSAGPIGDSVEPATAMFQIRFSRKRHGTGQDNKPV
jgi:hypothetical protein